MDKTVSTHQREMVSSDVEVSPRTETPSNQFGGDLFGYKFPEMLDMGTDELDTITSDDSLFWRKEEKDDIDSDSNECDELTAFRLPASIYPNPEHNGVDGPISGQTFNVECNTISGMSLPYPPDLSSRNKKKVTCTKKRNANANIDADQFTYNVELSKIKKIRTSHGINNGQNIPAGKNATLAVASDPVSTKTTRVQQTTLIADDRKQQRRHRNNEHARDTRLRKKTYIEDLEQAINFMITEGDARNLKERQEKQQDLELQEVRYRIMEEFLRLRAKWSDVDLMARWVDILEEGFTLTLPKTKYRTMVDNHSESVQILRGVTEVLEDASNVDVFVNTLVYSNSNTYVTTSYVCDRKNFMMNGVNAILDWSGSTSGATTQGAISELNLKGRMRATFSPASNKLASAELFFDTSSVFPYLQTIITK